MSIRLMCAAFDADVPATQKLVLLALCDNANDQGQCFPSIALLEKKCSLSDRAVQTAISWLEERGFLARTFRTGRATLYQMTPERSSPPKDIHPRSTFTPPPNDVHPTPEPRSPITVREPSSNRKSSVARKGSRLDPSAVLADGWEQFCRQERPDLDPQRTFARFKDYFIAATGANATKLDWFATWRNWVRNERAVKIGPTDRQAERMTMIFGTNAKKDQKDVIDITAQEIPNVPSLR